MKALTSNQITNWFKYAKRIALVIIAIAVCLFVWKMMYTTHESYDPITRIKDIKDMIRLNSLEIEDDFVYSDTLEDIEVGFVYKVTAKVVVGFDLENLNYHTRDGVLEVVFPNRPIISVYSLDTKLLDEYNTGISGDLLGEPNVDAYHWRDIRKNLERNIVQQVRSKNYEDLAKRNAMGILLQFCHLLNGDVRIIDNQGLMEPDFKDIQLTDR